MSKAINQQSPLVQVDLSHLEKGSGVQIVELPFLGHINLRGRSDNGGFMKQAKKVLGVGLPGDPNTWLQSGDLKIYWLGPDEWLIVAPEGRQQELEQQLRTALSKMFSSVTDVSSGQTMLRISGTKARAVLQKGCSLDLHGRVFKPGDCAQTLLAKAGMMISCVDESPTYELVIRRSFSDYVGLWLLDATAEFVGD